MVTSGLVVLVISNIFRCATAFLCASGGKFTLGEKTFIGVAWCPKAAV